MLPSTLRLLLILLPEASWRGHFSHQHCCPGSACSWAPSLQIQHVSRNACRFVFRIGMPPPVRIQLVSKMADIEHRLAYGTSDRLQLGALCGAFAGGLQAKLAMDAIFNADGLDICCCLSAWYPPFKPCWLPWCRGKRRHCGGSQVIKDGVKGVNCSAKCGLARVIAACCIAACFLFPATRD